MRKILTILLLILSLTAWGTKYYIDPAGNNGNDGSYGSPWATLSYACSQAIIPGDTVYVNPGTINETAQIVKPVGVSIHGAGDISIINSTYASSSSLQAAIQCASTAGTTTDDNSSISYIKLTGSSLTSTAGIFVGYRNNLSIHHVTIEDFIDRGIYLYVSSTYYPLFATGNKIYNCVINNSSSHVSGFAGCFRIRGQSDCDIYNNTSDMTERAYGSNGATMELGYIKKTKIHGNTFYRNDSEIAADGTYGWNFFVENWDYRGDCEYYNNTHYGLAKVSIGGELNAVDSDCSYGFKVYGNVFYNAANAPRSVNGNEEDYYCITVEGDQHNKVEVYNNYIQRYNWGIALTTPSSGTGYWHHNWNWDDIKIHHNVIENIGYSDFASSAIGICWINATNDPEYDGVFNNIVIANNTITGNNGGTYPGSYGIRMDANEVVTNVTIANNIIYGFAYNAIVIAEHANDSLSITGIDVVHNLMNNNGTNGVSVESAAGRITITDIDVATGNITGDPLFRSASDLHLQSTSPARDAGIDVSAITGGTDFHGASLYGAAYDIGAFEYGTGRLMLLNDTILPTINYKVVLIDH